MLYLRSNDLEKVGRTPACKPSNTSYICYEQILSKHSCVLIKSVIFNSKDELNNSNYLDENYFLQFEVELFEASFITKK